MTLAIRFGCSAVLAIAVTWTAGCAHVSRDAPPTAAVDRLMQPYTGEVPGASVLVVQDGVALVRKAYGMADLEAHVAATPATDYRLASVSKQFTATAIQLLVRDGKLALDDSIRRWLPELPAVDQPITLRHILTHTSGLVDYEELMAPDFQGQISDAGVLRLLAGSEHLYFAPGSAYRYSNSGYVLLGLVIERASGQTLPAFLRARIFAPLGMTGTLMYEHHRGPTVPHRAFGYSAVAGGWQRTDQSPTSATRGDGGIYSSIDDLQKWLAAWTDDRLLTAAERQLATSPQVTVTGEPYPASYGFGWRITGDTVWHSGETMGFRNVIVRWPKQRLAVVVLTNCNAPEPYHLALQIGALFGAR